MAQKRKQLKKNVKDGERVFFIYPRKDAALLDRAIKASGLSQTAFFVKAGKWLARVQQRADVAAFLEAEKTLSISNE